ncbi:MAG: pyridoxal phosphate-dependent aminotransferase [Rhodospirillales bacterium]|nr:pyridoxal phosphate-dependent aminotransferase [Rhodospirillales bacterium]
MALKVSRRGHVPPFLVMEVMQAAADRIAAGGEVLHLEVGQPGTPAPLGVREAAKQAINHERLGYTVALGIDPLREAIARHYADVYGVPVPAERIVVTTGSSAGFLLSFLACFEPGDRVALAEPGYPCYRNILQALGLEPVALPVDHNSRYQPTVAMLQALAAPVDGLIVASPSNPTGAMVSREDMTALAAHCRQEGIHLISDEIYHGIGYGMATTTAAVIEPDAVVINSFSKYFSMTGWRIGWMVVPEDLLKPIERLAQNMFISPPTLSQHAAVAAFECREELEDNVAVYAANRALLLEELPRAGLTRLSQVDGAFYIYADISYLTDDSVTFCRALLDDTGVAVTPGVDFDPVRGHRSLRISFSGPNEDMAEAARRLAVWLKRR